MREFTFDSYKRVLKPIIVSAKDLPEAKIELKKYLKRKSNDNVGKVNDYHIQSMGVVTGC